jgi:cytosine/adenosine deaminase-related metal-dependent hydrolase
MSSIEEVVAPSSANGSGLAPHPEGSEPHLNGDTTTDAHGLAELLHALQAMRVGDFSVRMAGDRVGLIGKIADTFNEIVATNQRMARQLERVGQVVGREGRTRQRVRFGFSDGISRR